MDYALNFRSVVPKVTNNINYIYLSEKNVIVVLSKLKNVRRILTMPIPSMANITVVKNKGICDTGATHGRDPMSSNGMTAIVASWLENGLTPVITHSMVHPKPVSIQVVAIIENGTKSRSERMIPIGRSGKERPKIQIRMDMCHSGDKCVSTTWNKM